MLKCEAHRIISWLQKAGEDEIIGGEKFAGKNEAARLYEAAKDTSVGFTVELIRTNEMERESSAAF